MGDDVSTIGSARRRQKKKFAKGAIVRVAMENFLTYDHFQFSLNPKLNVIIGPNGTGKSSIVCAICLGLGGKTGILARAKDIGEYIKHDETKAKIEIEICNEPDNVLICREIVKHSSKCVTSWFCNGVSVTSKTIEDTVKKLNIQLSNLCQFLPQEKVADFAKMNKIELLENTELAVCDPQTHKDHMTLKEFRSNEKHLEVKYNSELENLDMMKRKNERMEQDVVRFNERQKLLDQVENLEKKRAWTVYEEARKVFCERKTEWEAKKQEFNETRRQNATLEKDSEDAARFADRINQELKEDGVKLKDAANLTKRIHEQITAFDDDVKDKEVEFEEKEKYEKQRMKKMEQYHTMVDSWRKELSEAESTNEQQLIDQLTSELQRIVKKIHSIDFDSQTLHGECETRSREIKDCDRRIAHLNNMSNRRLEQLKSMNRDVHTAVNWLRKNRSRFKGQVYEPIMLLLKTTDRRSAEILENHIAARDMVAFVCEEPEDNMLLVSELREKQRLKINVVKAPRNNGRLVRPEEYMPQRTIHQLSEWGFTNYLRETFTAPDPVMAYLCKQYGVHRIPIGSEKTLDIVDQVTKHSGQTLFYIPSLPKPRSKEVSPGQRFNVKKSKYSSKSTVANRSLRNAQYLMTNVDPEQILEFEDRKKELQSWNKEAHAKISEFQKEKRELEKSDNEIRTRKKDLQAIKSRKRTLENNIQIKLKSIEDLKRNCVNIEELRQQLRESLGEIYMGKKKLTIRFSKEIVKCTKLSLEKAHSAVRYAAAINRKSQLDDKLRNRQTQILESKRKVEKAEQEKKEAQTKAKHLLASAKQKTDGQTWSEIVENDKDLLKIFADFPDTIPEMETLIHDYKARAECCTSTDPTVIDEYNRRQREIEALEKEVESFNERLQTSRNEIEGVKERWLKEMNSLVRSINTKFSRHFAQMGCAGEVALHCENPEEFDKYGIRIRVKFRSSSSLQELNPYRQSGGERSVSTMLYLMALQSLRQCPFRLVDEINQGMDPYNERRVFDIIVKSYCDAESSQYFLITPKLLPNLTYTEHMSVHCIYNGPHMLPCVQWKISRFKRHRRRLQYDDE